MVRFVVDEASQARSRERERRVAVAVIEQRWTNFIDRQRYQRIFHEEVTEIHT
jgi:hypothetical protein